MRLVKLDAIDSTNDFLKDLIRQQNVENFTVISAENQTKGKGQMGAIWNSEQGKNLIMSVLVKDFLSDPKDVFNLNIVISLSVIRSLEQLNIPKLSIKWPNDIMSDNKKIGGILIENSFKSDQSIASIVGIGLNVNQTHFENLPQASSLALISGTNFDKEKLLFQIVSTIQKNIELWHLNAELFTKEYTNLLFKKDVLMSFQNQDNTFFNGFVKGISTTGKLFIQNESGLLLDFDIKEIKMIF
jgi:BirA family biotin operon repressor/biotin-[acetyl-CoA-carboxylase] ligase